MSDSRTVIAGILAVGALVAFDAVADTVPAFCDARTLAAEAAAFKTGSGGQDGARARLLKSADWALKQNALSVCDKVGVPASSDRHDYMSIALYAWPDPTKKDGLPWINKDGQVNRKREEIAPDSKELGMTSGRIRSLAMAYAVTGDEKYAAKATELLRVWFLNADTKMNPNLNYAQSTPGKSTGSQYGIIEGTDLVAVLDSVKLLGKSPKWLPKDQSGMQDWMSAYDSWLTTSELGKAESQARNNHGTWYDLQRATIADFVGNTAVVKALVEKQKARIAAQISPDGSQPDEVKRTRPLQYSFYNLNALTQLATLGSKVGSDLWNFRTSDGRSLKNAIDYVSPCVRAGGQCPFKAEAIEGTTAAATSDVEPFKWQDALRIARRANGAYPGKGYDGLAAELAAHGPPQNLDPGVYCSTAESPLKGAAIPVLQSGAAPTGAGTTPAK